MLSGRSKASSVAAGAGEGGVVMVLNGLKTESRRGGDRKKRIEYVKFATKSPSEKLTPT